jgi:hypothetical protein
MQLVDRYKPTTIDAFAGVDRAKKILSAFVQKPYTSAWLLIGPSGLGKTTMAFAAAEAIGASTQVGGGVYHIPARKADLEAIDTIVGECRHRPMLGSKFNVVIIDEADRMTLPAQHALLSKLDSADPPTDTIWFFTANDTTSLEERFLSRCRKIQFSADGLLAPGAALLKKIWKAETKGKKDRPDEPDFELILRTAGFNVREALMLLETEILCPGSVCESEPAPEQSLRSSKGITTIGKGNGAGQVYTIGIDGMPADALQETVKALGVNLVADCCWKPQRAYRAAMGDAYEWAGDRLSGGRTRQGQREEGLKWLLGLVAAGKTVMMLYPTPEPGSCNRHHLIGKLMLERGVDLIHVFEEELILDSELRNSIKEDRAYKFKKWRLPKAVGA